jgi:hypothetical protein
MNVTVEWLPVKWFLYYFSGQYHNANPVSSQPVFAVFIAQNSCNIAIDVVA